MSTLVEDVISSSEAFVGSSNAEEELENDGSIANKTIIGSSLLYIILSYLSTFGNLAIYLVSYMRLIGDESSLTYQNVSSIYSVAILLQSLSGLFSANVEELLGTKGTLIMGCGLTAISLILSSFTLNDFYQFMMCYAFVGGIASGFTMPLPLDCVIRCNPRRRGYSCGCVYFLGGLGTIILAPLQTLFINGGNAKVKDLISQTEKKLYFDDPLILTRLPKTLFSQGCLYLILLAISMKLITFTPKDKLASEGYLDGPTIEYETFRTKRAGEPDKSEGTYSIHSRHYYYLWFLIYLSWQSMIYLHSYWKIVALLKTDASDLSITLIGALAGCANIFGRVLWGVLFDHVGWRKSWISLVTGTLILTLCTNFMFKQNIIIYGIWVTGVYFIHSGVFSIGPMTAHRLFGSKKFTMTVGFLNTARAAAGITALSYSSLRFSKWNDHLPVALSLICLISLLIIKLFNEQH